MTLCIRCGKDLKEMFSTPTIQHFINCKPMCEVYCDKEIYQPGTLRKVQMLYSSLFNQELLFYSEETGLSEVFFSLCELARCLWSKFEWSSWPATALHPTCWTPSSWWYDRGIFWSNRPRQRTDTQWRFCEAAFSSSWGMYEQWFHLMIRVLKFECRWGMEFYWCAGGGLMDIRPV